MNKTLQKLICLALAVCMLFSLGTEAFAAASGTDGEAEAEKGFDFECSDYSVTEGGTLTVKIMRNDAGGKAAILSIKAADMLSEYGTDYIIVDENGDEFTRVEGEKPDVNELVADDGTLFGDTVEESSVPVAIAPEGSGSSFVAGAAAQYLNTSGLADTGSTAENVTDALSDLNEYFGKAQGACGQVRFAKGETEKTITVKPVDNSEYTGTRLFMLAITGVLGKEDDVMIAPNATTYVNLFDDEAEKVRYSIESGDLVLTENAPTAEVTVKRLSCTEDFSTVYVSTVKDTAPDGSYDAFHNYELSFLPGETEKTVTVEAYAFDADGVFGLRLESREDADFDCGYINVAIQKEARLFGGLFAASVSSDILGKKYSTVDGVAHDSILTCEGRDTGMRRSYWVKAGSSANITITDANSEVKPILSDFRESYLTVKNTDSSYGGATSDEFNFAGVRSVIVDMNSNNYNAAVDVSPLWLPSEYFRYTPSSYSTRNTTAKAMSYSGGFNGSYVINYKRYNIDVSDYNAPAYLNFWTKRVTSTLYGVNMEHTLYKLETCSNNETFTRSLYDFSEKSWGEEGFKLDTFFDGCNTLKYNPGSVRVLYDGDEVNGFYSNANATVTIVPEHIAQMERSGLKLLGVYIANSRVSADDVPGSFDGGVRINNAVFKYAVNDEVNLSLDGDFVQELVSAGVASAKNPETETLKIYPVYTQELVTVIFKHGVSPDSYLWNVERSYENSDKKDEITAGRGELYKLDNYKGTGETVYAMKVPRLTVFRLRAVVGAGSTFSGICCKPMGGGDAVVMYHHAGDKIASSVDYKGITVTENDPSIADVPAENYELYPNAGEQSIYIGFHGSYDPATETMSMENRPEDMASRLICISDMSACDENGVIEMDAVSGNTYSFNIVPPEGYYVVWTNMSGDVNRNGVIDNEAEKTIYNDREKSVNPVEIYGNRLNITVDSDNIQYYYKFIELAKDSSGKLINNFTKTATVQRESNTFYRLVNNPGAPVTTEPVSGASVSVAQWSALTDSKGKFTVELSGLDNSGALSAVAMIEGLPFNFKTYIETTKDVITVPALYRFTAKSLTASYSDSDYKGSAGTSSSIIVEDDKLTISAQVGSFGTIRPADVKFKLTRDGIVQEEFTSESAVENVTVSFETRYDGGVAKLTFNPSKYMQSGDKLYISFMAEDGTWYPYIDTGYTFVSTLALEDLLLPIFGASIMDDVNDISVDLLGSVLSDLTPGSLSDLGDSTVRTVSPANISDAEKASGLYDWTELEYSGGMNSSMVPKFDKNSTEHGQPSGGEEHEFTEAEMAEGVKRLQEADNIEDAVKPKGSKYTTTKGYLWNMSLGMGFRLVVSQRSSGDQMVTCFEDLAFYLKVKTTVNTSISVALPIGISFAFKFDLDINVVGIYHLYNNYKEDNRHIEGTIPYDGFRINTPDPKVSREGYIFIDPTIKAHFEVSAGVLTVGGGATFTLDMDFAIRGDDKGGSDAYGGLDIDMDWYIKLLGFSVYKKNYDVYAVKMFGSEPINFDVGQNTNAVLKSSFDTSLSAIQEDDGVFSVNTPTDRSYIENRSEWQGDSKLYQGGANANAVTEKALMTGTATEPYMNLTRLGDGKVLMVFIGDDPERLSVNKRTIYWSLSEDNGTTWSAPVQLDPDGTLDDYPEVFDMGNGKLLVSWSSVDSVLPEGAAVEDALRQLNIKAAFFDCESLTFGEATQLTKTTDEDFCADTQPHAAYDSGTDRLILYYTKTEYGNISELNDLGAAESVTAYLFYEDGKWSNTGDAYTEKELQGAADPASYREQWYGQRFLDPRIDMGSAATPLIISSDAVCYNHLALYTWVTDWDNDRSTTDDRDVFLQVYNFNDNTFTHNFRITKESGSYTLPTLLRTDEGTLLFYGALNSEGESSIRYLNVGNAVADRHYTLCTDGSIRYYELRYTVTDEESGESEEIWEPSVTASSCGNIEDYTACCDGDGVPFLFWTDSDDSGRQVYAAMRDETGCWSLPYRMTDSTGCFYNGISAAILDGVIYVGSGKGSYGDASDTSIVMLKHRPSSNVVLDSISVDREHPLPGENVAVSITLVNRGLLPIAVTKELALTVNGAEYTTGTLNACLSGGESVTAVMNITVPAEFDDLTYTAKCDARSVSLTCSREGELGFEGGEVITGTAPDGSEKDVFTIDAVNKGNAPGSAVAVVYAGDKQVGSAELIGVPVGEGRTVSVELSLADADFTLAKNSDIAYADVRIEIKQGDNVIYNGSATAYRRFDSEAIELLSDASAPGDLKLKVAPGETVKLNGVAEGLRILWTDSADPEIAKPGANGALTGVTEGSTTVSGILVPDKNVIYFGADCTSRETDWMTLIPDYMLKTVTAELEVTEQTGRFPDVTEDDFYYESVEWIAEQGITLGYDDGLFHPDDDCDRAQAVTFLWRTAGCPDPESMESRFPDVVNEGDCAPYYKAILWAAEQGITVGCDDGCFHPFEPVTRAQFVTFLWRLEGKQSCDTDIIASLTDSKTIDECYREPIAWALKTGLIIGYEDGSFRPDELCARWAVALVLWRDLK